MKHILLLKLILIPLCFLGQSQRLRYVDSSFSHLVKDFKNKFSIEDTLGFQKRTEAKEYLKELNQQFKTTIFSKAKIIDGFRYINSYNARHVAFGVLEFQFSNDRDANHAIVFLRKRKFDDSWGVDQMFTCSKKYKNRLIFIYSPNFLDTEMESFMKNICKSNSPN